MIRSNLCGKRCEKTGRSVIGPDVELNIDEVGVPQEIANNLAVPEEVNQYNIEALQKLISEDKANFVIRKSYLGEETRVNLQYATHSFSENELKVVGGDLIFRNKKPFYMIKNDSDKFQLNQDDVILRNGEIINTNNKCVNQRKVFILKIGDIVERKLVNGDIILMNRQPTLHRGSMISQKIKILKEKTFRLNLAITSSFNADFDGDEMNCHLPSDIPSIVELENLSTVDNNINSVSSKTANIKVVQDTPLAIYICTSNKKEISRAAFWKIVSSIKGFDYHQFQLKVSKFKSQKDVTSIYTGDFLFSLLLEDDFSFQNNTVLIEKGILMNGVISKSEINKIISLLYADYEDVNIVKKFINNVQFLSYAFLSYWGFSISLHDCLLTKNDGRDQIEKKVQKAIMKAKSVNLNVVNQEIKEIYTRFSLCEARDIGLSLAKQNLRENNGFRMCVESGSKGSTFNILQIAGLLGQMEILGQRIKPTLPFDRTLAHYPREKERMTDAEEVGARGFIFSNFLKGLTPREFFFHSLSGREGICDTRYVYLPLSYLSYLSLFLFLTYLSLFIFLSYLSLFLPA